MPSGPNQRYFKVSVGVFMLSENVMVSMESKKISNYQELIQSDPIHCHICLTLKIACLSTLERGLKII